MKYRDAEIYGLHDLAEIAEAYLMRKRHAELLRIYLKQKHRAKARKLAALPLSGESPQPLSDNIGYCQPLSENINHGNDRRKKELQSMRSSETEDDIIARAF